MDKIDDGGVAPGTKHNAPIIRSVREVIITTLCRKCIPVAVDFVGDATLSPMEQVNNLACR